MVAHRAGALTVAVVAVAMLFAIGSWEVYQGTSALAQELVEEVNYKCWQISRNPAVRKVVTLRDQFGDHEVTVMEPPLLCAPATKVGITILPEEVPPHLKCYEVIPSGPPFTQPPPEVNLVDQFTPDGVEATVTSLRFLCAQVEKEVIGD